MKLKVKKIKSKIKKVKINRLIYLVLAIFLILVFHHFYYSQINIIKRLVAKINIHATYSVIQNMGCGKVQLHYGQTGTDCSAEAYEFYAGSGNMQQDFYKLQQRIVAAGFGPSIQFGSAEITNPPSAGYYSNNSNESIEIYLGNPSSDYLPKNVVIKPYPVGYVLTYESSYSN